MELMQILTFVEDFFTTDVLQPHLHKSNVDTINTDQTIVTNVICKSVIPFDYMFLKIRNRFNHHSNPFTQGLFGRFVLVGVKLYRAA